MPPPMHMVTTARLPPRRFSSLRAGADAELLLDVDRLAGEGLVDLEHVDVVDAEVVLGEQLLHRRDRAGAHNRRVDANCDE